MTLPFEPRAGSRRARDTFPVEVLLLLVRAAVYVAAVATVLVSGSSAPEAREVTAAARLPVGEPPHPWLVPALVTLLVLGLVVDLAGRVRQWR
jgi:hypothetical protein